MQIGQQFHPYKFIPVEKTEEFYEMLYMWYEEVAAQSSDIFRYSPDEIYQVKDNNRIFQYFEMVLQREWAMKYTSNSRWAEGDTFIPGFSESQKNHADWRLLHEKEKFDEFGGDVTLAFRLMRLTSILSSPNEQREDYRIYLPQQGVW